MALTERAAGCGAASARAGGSRALPRSAAAAAGLPREAAAAGLSAASEGRLEGALGPIGLIPTARRRHPAPRSSVRRVHAIADGLRVGTTMGTIKQFQASLLMFRRQLFANSRPPSNSNVLMLRSSARGWCRRRPRGVRGVHYSSYLRSARDRPQDIADRAVMLEHFRSDVQRLRTATAPPPARGCSESLRLATWNLNSLCGADGRSPSQPADVFNVMQALDADVLALQEVPVIHRHSMDEGWARELGASGSSQRVQTLDDMLTHAGYRILRSHATNPTLLATRRVLSLTRVLSLLRVLSLSQKFSLSEVLSLTQKFSLSLTRLSHETPFFRPISQGPLSHSAGAHFA